MEDWQQRVVEEMEDWQQRVVEEKAALDEKIGKLDAFTDGDNDTFNNTDEAEQDRLIQQLDYMMHYSRILGERIAAWTE